MFVPDQKADLSPDKVRKSPKIDLSLLSVSELISMHDQIRKHLPPTTIKDMDMEGELLLQFHTLRSLQNDLLEDAELPLNQRVSLANAVTGSLVKLSEMQEQIYSSERFKDIENLLIRALFKLPEDVSKAFLDDYAKILGENS